MPFPALWASKFALKFVITVFAFEIKERKNAQKVKNILTIKFIITYYRGIAMAEGHVLCGSVPPQNIFEI